VPPGQSTGDAAAITDPLNAWAAARGVTEATVDTLRANGCDTVLVVTSLLPEDVETLGLNLGQKRMLIKAISAGMRDNSKMAATLSTGDLAAPSPSQGTLVAAGLANAAAPLAATSASPAPLAAAGLASAAVPLTDLLDQSRTTPPTPAAPPAVDNPAIYLHLAAGKRDADYLDIIDFVPGDISKESESVIGNTEEFELVARSLNNKRSRLMSVTHAQWSAANSAIMAKLIQDGTLGPVGINEYLNYSFKIGDLGRAYTWASILAYDREYRQLQAKLGFAWGTDISHLRATTLISKTSVPQTNLVGKRAINGRPNNSATRAGKAWGSNLQSQLNLCRDYNRGSCTREHCKFVHRCAVTDCFERHSATSHGASAGPKN
jgi:hypothetical protein